jgi:hypothetical protein
MGPPFKFLPGPHPWPSLYALAPGPARAWPSGFFAGCRRALELFWFRYSWPRPGLATRGGTTATDSTESESESIGPRDRDGCGQPDGDRDLNTRDRQEARREERVARRRFSPRLGLVLHEAFRLPSRRVPPRASRHACVEERVLMGQRVSCGGGVGGLAFAPQVADSGDSALCRQIYLQTELALTRMDSASSLTRLDSLQALPEWIPFKFEQDGLGFKFDQKETRLQV